MPLPGYQHELRQHAGYFHLPEEVAARPLSGRWAPAGCMATVLMPGRSSRSAANTVHHWPDAIAGCLRSAGFEIAYAGQFVDQGLCQTQ